MEPREKIKPVVEIIEAFAQRDTQAFITNMTEDVLLRPSAFISGRAEYRGREQVHSGFAEMFAELDARGEHALISPSTYYVDAEDETKVLVLAKITILPKTGDVYGTEIAYLVTLRDGRLSEVEAWLDHGEGLSRLSQPIKVA